MDLINKYLKEQTPGYEYEYNYEGDMAKTQLNMMIDASMELKSMLANDTNLPEWVQSKITKAADYIDSARDYMKNMNKDPNGSMGEDIERKDTGWQKAQTDRKDQFGNRIKNVARRLARQGMQSAVKDLKKGPEAGKRQVEEVEDLEELKRSTIRSYGNKRIIDLEGDKSVEAPFKPKPKSFSNPKRDVISTGLVRASARLSGVKPTQKEEVELDEAETSKLYNYAFDKYVDITSGKNKKDKEKAPGYEKIARNAFKMGISRPMKKSNLPEEVEELDELKQDTLKSYADKAEKDIKAKKDEFKAQGGQMRKKSQRALDAKISNRYKGLFSALRKVNLPTAFKEEVEELDELKVSTLTRYGTKAMQTYGRNPEKDDKRLQGIQRARAKVQQKAMNKEGVELDEELTNAQKDSHFTLMNKHRLAAKSAKGAEKDKHLMAAYDHQHALQNPWYAKSHSDAMAASKRLGVTESVELDEGLKSKLAAMGVAATMAASPAAARVTDGGQSFAQQTAQQTTQPQSVKAPKEIPSKSYLQNVASGKSRSMMHPDTAKELLKKHYSEEVDLVSKYSKLGEAKYPGFRSSSKTRGGWSRSVRMRGVHSAQPSYDQDPRTGLPLGFSPAKEEPKKAEPPKKTN